MEMQNFPAEGTPAQDYPAPPRVHWTVLLLAMTVLTALASKFTPTPYHDFLASVIVDAWPFYLCLWIRKLNPDANSIFWCDLYIVVQLCSIVLGNLKHQSVMIASIAGTLVLASTILAIATAFIIRAELLKHYNEREPIGIYLSTGMTLFFSFLYFQSQLYPIAKYKKDVAEGKHLAAGRTLIS